ncbi:MAG: PPOX class F420-dependent oxidoreductase [Terriglobales bacterium]
MGPAIPAEISGQRYISLATFRKNGTAVNTPVWFAEENGHLYVMTSGKTGKSKRIRNNLNVKIAPCSARGKITGPEFRANVRFLKPEEFQHARKLINAKYWLARVSFLWPNTDTYLEITPASA